MQLGQRVLEVANANAVVGGLGQLLGAVIDSIELANFVGEANLLEQRSDTLATAQGAELGLADAVLGKVRREQEIDGLGLISIILSNENRVINKSEILFTYLVIGHTLEVLVGNVFADGGHAE